MLESNPPLPARVLSRPSFVPLMEFEKDWRLGANHDPDEFRFILEMNDVKLVVLFFDRNALLRTFFEKSSNLQRVCRPRAWRMGA